jgi:hypothetical protein
MDPQEELLAAYQEILNLMDTWQDHCRPLVIPESDSRLPVWDDTREHCEEWMTESEMIAVAGYRLVLKDGEGFCSSESEAEYSGRPRRCISFHIDHDLLICHS